MWSIEQVYLVTSLKPYGDAGCHSELGGHADNLFCFCKAGDPTSEQALILNRDEYTHGGNEMNDAAYGDTRYQRVFYLAEKTDEIMGLRKVALEAFAQAEPTNGYMPHMSLIYH
eukprot:gene4889-2363_t